MMTTRASARDGITVRELNDALKDLTGWVTAKYEGGDITPSGLEIGHCYLVLDFGPLPGATERIDPLLKLLVNPNASVSDSSLLDELIERAEGDLEALKQRFPDPGEEESLGREIEETAIFARRLRGLRDTDNFIRAQKSALQSKDNTSTE